jgi:hypothetical protein
MTAQAAFSINSVGDPGGANPPAPGFGTLTSSVDQLVFKMWAGGSFAAPLATTAVVEPDIYVFILRGPASIAGNLCLTRASPLGSGFGLTPAAGFHLVDFFTVKYKVKVTYQSTACNITLDLDPVTRHLRDVGGLGTTWWIAIYDNGPVVAGTRPSLQCYLSNTFT